MIACSLFLTLGCKYSLEANAIWESSPPCTSRHVPCGKVVNSFGNGNVTRFCGANGKWSTPNYSQCKVREKPGPFVIAWINFIGESDLVNA